MPVFAAEYEAVVAANEAEARAFLARETGYTEEEIGPIHEVPAESILQLRIEKTAREWEAEYGKNGPCILYTEES